VGVEGIETIVKTQRKNRNTVLIKLQEIVSNAGNNARARKVQCSIR
jgi:hypothetical protein